jgi:hypothetical protein
MYSIKMKYFSIDLSTINSGLSHQISNLNTLIRYCYKHEYILILPHFRLYGVHNNGKEVLTNLSKYINFKTLLVNNKFFEVVMNRDNVDNKDIMHIEAKKYRLGLLRNDDMFNNLENVPIKFSYNEDILTIGKQISALLGNYLCIHVRRTDRVTTEQINKDTSPNNILEKIKKYDIKNVYIMTNEEISFFNKLKEQTDYNIHFFTDFEILRKIKEEDNYFLFCIENIVCDLADKQISTFKTDRAKYIDYLSETKGWQ